MVEIDDYVWTRFPPSQQRGSRELARRWPSTDVQLACVSEGYHPVTNEKGALDMCHAALALL